MGLKSVIKIFRKPKPITPAAKPKKIGKIKGEITIDGKTKKSHGRVLPENIDIKKTNIFQGSFEIGNYTMKYSRIGKHFYITNFNNYSKMPNLNEMKLAVFTIKDIAKSAGSKFVFCNTWIFAKNTFIKNELGFIAVNPKAEKKYIALLKENELKTLEARRIPYPEYYLKI